MIDEECHQDKHLNLQSLVTPCREAGGGGLEKETNWGQQLTKILINETNS